MLRPPATHATVPHKLPIQLSYGRFCIFPRPAGHSLGYGERVTGCLVTSMVRSYASTAQSTFILAPFGKEPYNHQIHTGTTYRREETQLPATPTDG